MKLTLIVVSVILLGVLGSTIKVDAYLFGSEPGWGIIIPLGQHTVNKFFQEDKVNLEDYEELAIIGAQLDIVPDKNIERAAGKLIKALGFYNDYQLKKEGGHWILWRSAGYRKISAPGTLYRMF